MRVCVALEQRFDRTPDGAVWTPMVFAHAFWTRYLDSFEHVRIVARMQEVTTVPADWQRVDGPGVSAVAVPHYLGPWQYLRKARQVQRAVCSSVGPRDAVILRVGSQIAACLEPLLQRTGHPYGVEVVGDPYDTFAPGAMKNPLRPFFRQWFTRQLQRQCTHAAAAAYVTAQALQRHYPCPNYTTNFSSIQMTDEDYVPVPRVPRGDEGRLRLITVGSLAQLYKAPDVLIEAVALCVRAGLDLELVLVGDGQYRVELEAQAHAAGITRHVQFIGQLSARQAIRAQLDQADLFVLPSRQEGLPRAMIEAMGRALPCIGSTVGGIPELLPAEDLVAPGDVAALATKIREVVTDVPRMVTMSARNLAAAQEYHEDVLRGRRVDFYREVRQRTTEWIQAHDGSSTLVGTPTRDRVDAQ
jgi:glycosyltransferase involved in cell wall biosynthesis